MHVAAFIGELQHFEKLSISVGNKSYFVRPGHLKLMLRDMVISSNNIVL